MKTILTIMSDFLNPIKASVQNNFVPIAIGSSCCLAVVAGSFLLREQIENFRERKELTTKRIHRQQVRNEQFLELEKKFPKISKQSLTILDLSFEDLQGKLERRELTAKNVLEAFVAKSIFVTKEFNCVTEFVPDMWKWADELDQLAEIKGPLHGIPICVKDDHNLKGMDSTLGLSKNLEKPAQLHAVVIQQLINAGAIPFCKTNIPQTLYSAASHNPIYGTTLNPLNKKLSPGGSSSGSACLVGAGGAHFGTGSDIGGSLRLPAHFCGICTLKPTIGRVSGKGVVQCFDGVAGYTGVSGILAKRAKTLSLVFKTLTLDSLQNKCDPLTLPLPWNDQLFLSQNPLKIGYCTSIPQFPAMGDTPSTILEAKLVLENLGHDLTPFDLPDNDEMVHVYCTLADADGQNQNYKKLKNDQVSHVVQGFMEGRTLVSKIGQAFGKLFAPRKTVRDIDGNVEGQRSEVLWDYLEKQKRIQYQLLDRMETNQLDLLLVPAYPFPACRIEDAGSLPGTDTYTVIWNLVNFPAGIVPFGQESCTNVDNYDDQGDRFLKVAKEGIKSSKGMPIGVQIVGKPYMEEIVLRILKELDEYKLKQNA